MIELTYSSLRSNEFLAALDKVSAYDNYPKDQKLLYNVAKIYAAVQKESKVMHADFRTLLLSYTVLDDKGNLKPAPNGQFPIIPEKLEEWRVKQEEFNARKFTIDRSKINFSDLAPLKLSPIDIEALEPLLLILESA